MLPPRRKGNTTLGYKINTGRRAHPRAKILSRTLSRLSHAGFALYTPKCPGEAGGEPKIDKKKV